MNTALAQQQQAVQQRIEHAIKDHFRQLDDHAPRLKAAMEYALLNGGKRMRPLLVYSVGNMLGLALSDLDPIALAIECIHGYSLIHDDLPAMDDDDLRRGKPTCHIQFDEATAILAGDALQTMAFDVLANAPLSASASQRRITLLQSLVQASGYAGMCGGQAMDLAATDNAIEQHQLELLHQKKTGALLRAAILMPSQLLDIPTEHSLALENFARHVGLAFQVQDDILDIISDSQTLGKPQGSDQAHNKSTYPALMGLDGATAYLHELHQQALHALASLPYNTEILRGIADYLIHRKH
ncbi:(2E,6E)-farnesyl diphosphate synthase [Aestuariibacter halophilus]|uniref:(2E,6E)-farnesyl diphosphate synthase n=1 Tax=Fluctibacter halophilus TaxID=226011 RepID=A0ABS8G2B7_9ALTE|nr:farnesyl diphosphate synthase [Aestuariibacter halophilus]MCC2614729.1 (2E,6E)-farnesyl diphosphate synthase [Aestuariibacter halophilus]